MVTVMLGGLAKLCSQSLEFLLVVTAATAHHDSDCHEQACMQRSPCLCSYSAGQARARTLMLGTCAGLISSRRSHSTSSEAGSGPLQNPSPLACPPRRVGVYSSHCALGTQDQPRPKSRAVGRGATA